MLTSTLLLRNCFFFVFFLGIADGSKSYDTHEPQPSNYSDGDEAGESYQSCSKYKMLCVDFLKFIVMQFLY